MKRLVIFSMLVLVSGWVLGYFLAQQMHGKQAPTPLAILISLGAVLAPALVAMLLSSGAENLALLKQFRMAFPLRTWAVALSFPFILALIGHIAGVATAKEQVSWIPAPEFFRAGLQMLPIAIVWGMLEEVGWRGFLTTHLAEHVSPLKACLIVGFVWGIWHAPQMFFSDQPFEGAFKNNPVMGSAFWTAACIAYGGVLGWLQLRTGSFVLPTICHALINIFGKISEGSMAGRMDPLWAGSGGMPGIVLASAFVFLLFRFL